ncbi:MAG: hypothetical protein GC168_06365 [Candidatus Hydrogenedens sp.]|nr:hypothetical protein [Candidatus Hydrogenedens sp.]
MWRRALGKEPTLTTYLLALLLLAVATGGLGLWLGRLSVSDSLPPLPPEVQQQLDSAGMLETESDEPAWINPAAPPMMFYASPRNPEEWKIFEAQVEIAGRHQLHLYMFPANLTWQEPWDASRVLEKIGQVVAQDPHARVVLELRLDPPERWLDRNATAVLEDPATSQRWVSPTSPEWQRYAAQESKYIAEAVGKSEYADRVAGYALAGLEEQAWKYTGGYDRSPSCEAAFREWLVTRYGSETATAQAWKRDALPAPLVPEYPNVASLAKTFLYPPADAPLHDFQQFYSEMMANTLAHFATTLREAVGDKTWILTRYGYGLEEASNASGHHALERLLTSEFDGFISPVSYANRGIGGTGGVMGPVDSAKLHGKLWFHLDDTRTGVARDPISGAITRLEGLRADDVYNVQARNFGFAASRGHGLIWSDPHAEGWLHDEEQWAYFEKLQQAYCEVNPEYRLTPEASPEDEGTPDAASFDKPGVVVVLDENSRAFQRSAGQLNTSLLRGGRDAAAQSGVPVRYVLFSDFIEGRGPEAPVYFFLDAFSLSVEYLERMHQRFAAERSAVIWQYAPGYIRDMAAVGRISELTGIKVKMFDGESLGGSRMLLQGRWVRENETYGLREKMAPLFYIDDEDADTIGAYEATEKSSLAIKTLSAGWTSVFLADPGMTPAMLREILRILEQPSLFLPTTGRYIDTAYFGNGIITIHGRQVGERTLDLGGYFKVTDLLDPTIGWPETDGFVLALNAGETRILKLEPIPSLIVPEEDIDDGATDSAAPEEADTAPEEADTAPEDGES